MAKQDSTPRERALELLQQALATGIRGFNREAVQSAIEVLQDDGKSGLSDLHYKNLPEGETLRDPNRVGLCLYHGKRTGKVWQYDYTSPITGKRKPRQFGTYPAMSLMQARERWMELRSVVAEGRDPFEETQEAQSQVTVKELVRLYITDYAIGPDRQNPRKRSWKEDQRMFEFDLLKEEGLGNRPVMSVTDDDVADLLEEIIERGAPRSAEKLRTACRKMWAEAIKRNNKRGVKARKERWVPGLTHNPWKSFEFEKRETETAFLNESQIKSFLQNLPKLDLVEVYKDAILFQFLTVSRVGEVVGLKWDEVDLDECIWTLPAARSKNKQAHRVLLSKQAKALLKRRKTTGEYVFPATRSTGHIPPTLISRHIRNNLDALGAPKGFASHGLRHTALTQMAAMKIPKHIRDRISNHKDRSIDSIYQHYEYDDEAKKAWQQWANRLDAFAASNVTVLKGKVHE